MEQLVQITDQQILEFVGRFLWPFFRLGAMFMAMPLFGAKVVPARVRLTLAFAVTIVLMPLLPPMPVVNPLSIGSMLITLQQIIIGVGMGFSLQVFFQIFVLGGQIIAGKLGLGFASMNDPASGVSVPVIAQFYTIAVTLLFFAVDAHVVALEAIAASFYSIPIGQSFDTEHLSMIIGLGSWMFNGAVLMSLPLLTALLIVNMAFGVMSKAAPQMNIFAVGFPMTLVFGLLLMWFSLISFLPNFYMFLDEALYFLQNLAGNP